MPASPCTRSRAAAGAGPWWAGPRTDLSGLSAPEAQALFLLVGPATAASATSGEAKAALRKLVRALPQTFRAEAEAAAGATMIDPTRWGERERPRPPRVVELQAAVVRRRKVRLSYLSARQERSERLVDPWGLVDKDDVWYLVAGTDRGRRTFRVDRIVEALATDEPAERPDDFELAEAWEEVVGEMEQRRSRTWATVLIERPLRRHPARPFRPPLPGRGRGRRRPGPDAGGRSEPARPGPQPGGLGRAGRGARAGRRPRPAGPDRARAGVGVRRQCSSFRPATEPTMSASSRTFTSDAGSAPVTMA